MRKINTEIRISSYVSFHEVGEEYTPFNFSKDEQGNTTTKSLVSSYAPRQVTLAGGMDGKVLVPNVQHSFKRADGNEVISTDQLTLNDGSVVSGNYDIYATVRSDAQFPVVINGVTVQPGQTNSVYKQMSFFCKQWANQYSSLSS